MANTLRYLTAEQKRRLDDNQVCSHPEEMPMSCQPRFLIIPYLASVAANSSARSAVRQLKLTVIRIFEAAQHTRASRALLDA